MSNYSKSELLLLKYADGHNQNSSFPAYFTYNHKLDVDKEVKRFLEDGLLEKASVSFVLNKASVSQLKEFATQYGIKQKSPKSAFIDVIISSVSEEDITQAFPDKYYVLSYKGQVLITENLTDDDFDNRYTPELSGFDEAFSYIKKKKYNQAEDVLKGYGYDPAINHSKYKVYDLYFKHKIRFPKTVIGDSTLKCYMILYYLYGSRAETAAKNFKNRTSIEIPCEVFHKNLKVIRAIDDLIGAKETAKSFKGSNLIYTYTIRTCKDNRVCPACSAMEGKSYNALEAVIGYNYPPFDKCTCDFCRCFASFDIGNKS